MRTIEVTLSDGKPLSVRRLGLFELDNVAPDKTDPGPFFYPIELAGGKIHEVPYDIYTVDTPPDRPDTPRHKAEPKSPLWFEWQEYDIFQAAQAHERNRLKVANSRLRDIAEYILDTCISPDDRYRIETPFDWDTVQRAALAPQVTMMDIDAALNNSLGAKWRGKPILEALDDLPEFGGAMDSIRQWEIKLMMKLGKSEAEYAMMDVSERARMIVADKVDDWMGALSSHEQAQKSKSKARKGK